jgi:GH24 family phage-related lysozyme (muramidase)
LARNVTTNVGVNVKTNGAKRAASEVGAVGAALRKLGNNAETTTESTTKLTRTQTRLGQASASTGRQFSSQAAGLGGLVGAYAGAAATIFALQQAFSALNRAAQAETIIRGTQTLAAQIGESGNKIISSLQGITEGQLSMVEAAEKANMALASGFNTSQIERLTNVALKASRALGRNLNEAFERLVRGSAKLEPELLDELGIFTRLDPAVEAYAKQLGKAAKDLTQFERRQAFVNAVIEEGERKFSAIDTTAPSAQKSLEQLSTTISDLGTKFGILLANALVPVANFFTEDLSLAISAFALIVRQVGAVAFTQIGEAATRAGANLNAWAATTLSTTASNQRAQASINAMNEALTELGRTYARGSLGDVNQANAMFTQMREGTITVTQLKDAQRVLEQQIKNSNSAIDQNTQELARLESQGKQNTKLYAQLNRSITQAKADLVQYDNALIAVTAAQETQTKTTLAGARALTFFNAAARVTAATLGLLMRAFNIFLLLASFGPIILKLVGQVEILNGIVENVTRAFNDYKLSIDSVRTGVATIASDANIDKITEKFRTLGLAAEEAAKNQQNAIEILNKLAEEAAAPGLIEATLNILPGFGTALKEAIFGVPGQDNINLQVLEGLDSKIQELQSTLASSNLNPAEALNLRQTLESLEAMRDAFGDTNFRVREFAGILASLTGLQASNILDTLTESSDQLAVSINGVVVATRDNLGQSFAIANQNAAELITQFVGFSSVISNANDALATIGTPTKELIAIGEQLTNSQSNLNNVIAETRARVADYYEVIRQEDATARAALARGDREAAKAAMTRSVLATLERDRLVETLRGVSAVTRRENERLEEIKKITDELAKQEVLYDNILKKFSSQLEAFKGADLSGEFSFGADGIKIASNEFERLNNQLASLRSKVSEYGATTEAEFANLGARLQAELGDRVTLATGEIVEGFNASKETVVQFIQRIEGAKIANQQLAGEVAKVLANEQLLKTEAEIVLGTFIQQLPALRALATEAERFARQQQVSQLTALGENRISTLQQELKSTQTAVQLRREESDLQRRLNQARLSTINAQRQGAVEQLRAQDQLLNSQKEQLQIQQEIAELKITAAQNEKEAAKSLLEIGKSGIEASSLFGDDFKEIIGVIADLGAMNLDIGIAEDELTKKQLKIENLDQLAAIEQQSIENRRQIAAIEHEQRLAALEQEIVNIEYQFEKDMEVLADRAAQIDTERQILEIRKTIADAQMALEQENLKTEIQLMQARIEEANRLILGMQEFIANYQSQNINFIGDLDVTQQKLIDALEAAAATIAAAAANGGGAAGAARGATRGGAAAAGSDAPSYGANQSRAPVGYGAGAIDPRLAAAAASRTPLPVTIDNPQDISDRVSTGVSSGFSDGVADFIKTFEGFSNRAYPDQRQYAIGYGTKANSPDEVITEAEASARFSAELSRFTGAVEDISSKYGYNWNESQKTALTSFAYNLGEGALEQLTAQGTRNNQQIAEAMLLYTNVASDNQRIEASLANRRRQEQEVFLSGLDNFADRLENTPTPAAGGLDLSKSTNDINRLAEGVDDYYTTIKNGNDAVYNSQLATLDAQESSLERQRELRTDINREEVSGARAALDAARAAGNVSESYWDQESQNASARARRDKMAAQEEERQAERQLKLLKLREAQATFQGLSKFGGFLESITTTKAKDALTKAEEEYNSAMEKRSAELEKLKTIREKENDVLSRSMELMDKRREIEQKYIETVGLGIEGANAYYDLQREYLDNINQAAAQSADYGTLARERTLQTLQLSMAEMEVVAADRARTEAEAKLNNSIIKTIGSIGGFIRKLGEFGNALISIGSLVSGLTAASGQGGIFGNILKGFGLDFKALKSLPKMIANAIAIPFQLNAGKSAETAAKTAEAATSVTNTVKGLSGLAQTLSTGFSLGIASVGIAQKIGILGDQPTTANYVGGALGGILGTYIGGLVAGAIAGSSFGAALGWALGPIGGLLGGLLGSFLGDLFARTKTSVGSVNLQTGAVSSSGEKGGELAPLAKSANAINDLIEDIIGAGTRASNFQAVFSRKGSKVKQKELQITVAGETFTKQISDDAEQLGKDMFELIVKGFTSVGNADVRLAISRLDFDRAVEDNLKAIDFAAGFRGVINNLQSRLTGSFVTIAEEVELIAAAAAQNLDQLTGGLMRNFRDLRTEAEQVFGETSSQVKELDDSVQKALLTVAGITVSAGGVVRLIEKQSASLNNMALIFAQTEGEMLGFKDALVETGMSAAQADRILREAADLKMLKIAEDFYQAVSRATEVAKGIDPSVYENIEKILNYQKDIVRDAQTIQNKFPSKFSDAVAKAEELALIQRLRLVAEGTDEQLKAIRLLTSVTGEFADATVQAAVQAEIASRTLLAAFNTSEIQKSARRSEARLAFNYASVGLATGGMVSGSGAQQNKDSVPAMLMPGEFVLNKESAQKIGYDTLFALNSGNFVQMAAGGAVQTGLTGGTTATLSSARSDFAAYEIDANTAFISFAEAANILTDANEDLYDSYLNIFKSINSNLVPALQFVQDQLAEGNVLQARATFEYATNVRAAVSSTDALNQIVAESRTQEALRAAGLIASIDEIDNFVKASDAFYLAVQQPQDYLIQSQGLYKKLYAATNELNKLLAQGTISTDEYNSAIDSLNNAYNDSIELVKEYNDFFIDLNDSLDNTGALSAVRETVNMYVSSLDKINYAVEDGVISTREASDKTIELNRLYNQKRLELVQSANEEQLKVLRDAANTAEDYGAGVATIVDFTYQAGAAMELVARQLQAASVSFSKFEVSLVDFYNSTLQTSTGFGSRMTKSVESIFLEAGMEFDDALGTFYGSVGNFAVAAQQGLIGLGNLEQAINELNYQLIQSEEIDIETYQTGISILQTSFMDFISTFQEMRGALDTTKDSMESFRSSLLDSFNTIQEDITGIVEGMVSNYRSNFENLKGLFDSAVSQQASAEEELYNTLFDAQKAFAAAGGNLSGHVDRINDIVAGLDPQYTGYAGLDQYLVDLKNDIVAGTAEIGNIDTKIPLATLKDNLAQELASLTALQALPDSADKFVRISRALSRITDLESQIASSTDAVDNLKEAALQLVGVEKELNLNNTTAGLTNVDLTLTEIQEDLVKRAVDARAAYNDANAVLDGYNAALATNTVFIKGLADVVPSVSENIANFTSRLSDASAEFLNVQTAISNVTAAGLTQALDNIVFNTDAYNIDVQPFSDSSKVLAELTTAISEYQNILNAKAAYEALYGALDITAATLPIDEFNELNAELVSLESQLLAVARNMDPTITNLDTLDSVFRTFVLDAISLLETPIQLDIAEPRGTSALANYTVATNTNPANAVGFGTSATNSILQAILTQGLGVQSPGYLYYTNLYLEDIRSILSEMLIVSGGVVPALNDIAAPIASATTSTTTGGTMYAGPMMNNLSGLTGQLFSVTEPIAMPADYFYIIVPQVIKLQDIIEVIDNEIALNDLITIVKEESSIDMWMNVAQRATSFEEWFTISALDRTIEDFYNIIKLDKSFDDFINIVKQDMDYRMWFHQPTPMPTNYLKWFIPTQEETSWGAWFAPPTLTETGFADWFSWPPTTKWDTDAYDWFTLEPKDIRYIDFFNVSQTLDINEFIAPTAINGSDLFNINTSATTFDEWFYVAPLAALTFNDFFMGISKGMTAFADWFTVDSPKLIQPNELYVVDKPITLGAKAFYNLIPDDISGSEIYNLAAPLSVAADELVKINEMTRIPVNYTEVFDPQTVRLHLTDMFDNYTVNGGFEFTKATIDSSQLFDVQNFNNYGFKTKLLLSAPDIFEGVDDNGVWSLSDREKIRVTANTFFNFDPLDNPFDYFFNKNKVDTNFYQWFDVPGKINISNVFEVFDPIPLDLLNVFDISNTREALAPSQVFTISPNPTVVQASQVFDIGAKYVVNGNEVFTFQPYKILASEVIDFSYIKTNPYLLVAADVLDVVNKLQLDFNEYIEITSKAMYKANELIQVDKSTFYGADLLNIIATDYLSEEVFTISSPTALPGSSFYSISAPTALPASTFIGVDQNRKIQYQFSDVFAPLTKQLSLGDIFQNYSTGSGFTWVKYTLAVEDVIDLTVLTTSGLRDKVTLSVEDLVENFSSGTFQLTNRGDIDYNSLFNPIKKLDSNYYTWFSATKLFTTFADWFYMGDASKLDLNMLVNNTVPLDYRNVFNFSNATAIKPANWDQALNFDAATKIKVRSADAFLIEASVYDAAQFIEFDQWKVTVSDLLDASYVRANPAKFGADELIFVTEVLKKPVSELLSITDKINVDVNSLVNPVPSNIVGSALFSPTATSLTGDRFFKPTQSALAGSAFFTPIATAINANDLFIISEKVPIDVTATFKSDFMEMVNAIKALEANAIPYLQRMDDNLKSQPVDSAVAFYNQIWKYYQDTFLAGYYNQWTPKIAKLADIAMSVATMVEIVKEMRDTLNALWDWTINTYDPKVDAIITLLTEANAKTDALNNWLSAIETTANSIESLTVTANGKIDTTNSWLNAIETTANSIESLTVAANAKTDTSNTLLREIRDLQPEAGIFNEMKGLLDSIDLTLFGIKVGTDYIDDVEKVLRESIYLRAFKDLINVNKYRYIYSGASAVTVPGFKTGGLVEGPGTGTSDSIPARLSDGEFVLTASTVANLGTDFLNALNQTGDLNSALRSFGIKGDSQVAHINDAEAALLKSLGGSGSVNTMTGLKQFFFDGRPNQASTAAQNTITDSQAGYTNVFSKSDGYPQWLYSNNASSYTNGYNANSTVGYAISALIRGASYAKGKGLIYEHKNWHRIGDYYWGARSTNPSNYSEFGYDWNDWNSSIDATSWMGNPSSLQGTYGRNDWDTLASRIWSTWGVNNSTITPEGRALAQQFSIPGYAEGGYISGEGSNISDSMLARLSDGEYVFRNSSVDNLGVPTLDYMNRTGELPRGDTTVEINITNNGQPVDVEGDPQVRFDGEKIVVDVVLKDLRTNGPIKRTLKKIK